MSFRSKLAIAIIFSTLAAYACSDMPTSVDNARLDPAHASSRSLSTPPCTVSCEVNEQSQMNVTIFLDEGGPLPLGYGPIFPGVQPGRDLVARVHISSQQGGEGISGDLTGRIVQPDGTLGLQWTGTSDEQGIFHVRFKAGSVPGVYRLIGVFSGASRTGTDGVTTKYTGSSAEGTFSVGVTDAPPPCPPTGCSPPPPCPPEGCAPAQCPLHGCAVQMDVTISLAGGGPLPPNGVAPGTNLLARVNVKQGTGGFSGALTGRVLQPDFTIASAWIGRSNAEGLYLVPFQAGAVAGVHKMIAVLNECPTGPNGVTLMCTGAAAERTFMVAVANAPPVARAGADQSVFRTTSAGAMVSLDGTASTDAEGSIASYKWFESGVLIATGPTPERRFTLGAHSVMLEVADAAGSRATDFVNIEVKNVPPIARAGDDQTLECVNGGALATLNASASTDIDGTIATYKWAGSVGPASVPKNFSLGTRQVLLGVVDNDGATDNDNVQINVQDTRPPTIDMVVSPRSIWPPNRKMVRVATGIGASDSCSPNPTLTVTVATNEGAPAADWEIIARPDGRYDVSVRADRAGRGTGRVYTITATATDVSGNVAVETSTVTVPHNQ